MFPRFRSSLNSGNWEGAFSCLHSNPTQILRKTATLYPPSSEHGWGISADHSVPDFAGVQAVQPWRVGSEAGGSREQSLLDTAEAEGELRYDSEC